ncbi:hypothetical protein [Loktanella sp. IMCC34160]|uniref:hypothetical protein n=1 Tax=Loktanella sp. IMCC34160 TaxID=2510646 RepID=UPI0013EA70A6|nr:hypothetical protein [Loktanella sp. IMCC34160]
MTPFLQTFVKSEDGNTTIDWMVLTAGLLLLSVAVATAIGGPTTGIADETAAVISTL